MRVIGHRLTEPLPAAALGLASWAGWSSALGTGMVRDLSDPFAILRLARRIAGEGRVVNEIEFVPIDDDGN